MTNFSPMLAQLNQHHLELDSKLDSILRVEQLIDQLRDELTLGDEIIGNIIVAVTEAVNNAIIHGNKLNPKKKVTLSVGQENNHLVFIIQDSGTGFDYNNLPDPTAPENLEKPTGRGVFLMKHLSDLVIFSDNGNQVEIHFKL